MQIDGRTILIAGGTSGLGAATARRLAERGARVLIGDVDERGAELAAALGDHAEFATMDVTDETTVAAAIRSAVDRFGGLQGAVVCAGILGPGKVLTREGPGALDAFRRVVEVNLVGTFNVVRLVAEAVRHGDPDGEDGERGVIVLTSSIAAYESQIGQAAYAASKGGVASMTLPIARELARHGIRVVSVAPGVFETPMMAGVTDEVRRSLAEQIPFPPRLGRPEEFAALVEHIITNPMINGAVLRIDGAMRMQAR